MSPSIEPFDEAKYKALMGGLECNEVLLSGVKLENPVFRFDAEYFNKEVLSLVAKIKTKNNRLISSSFNVSKLAGFEFTEYFTPKNMSSNDYYIALTSKNIQQNRLDLKDYITIDKRVADTYLKRSSLKKNDVVLSYTGEYRRALTLFEEGYQLGPNVCRLTAIDKTMNAHYLSVFFNCAIGQKILDREKTLSAQPTVAMSRIRAIRVPLFEKIQIEIEKYVTISNAMHAKAKELFSSACRVLSKEFDFDNVPNTRVYTKRKNDSFAVTDRLDAEYYQPKYESIAQKLNTSETVLSLCKLYDKNFVPQRRETYQYIELSDVGQSGDISDVCIQYGSSLPTRARRIVKSGQIIVSSVDGSLESCALITDEYDGSLCSNGFYVLDSDCINSETLLVLFKSEPIQALLKQRCSGTILTAISKDELLSMPLPMIDEDVQKVIAAKVQESFSLRRKSKQLLEYAKQAVEMAIEQDEKIAFEWLQEKADEEV